MNTIRSYRVPFRGSPTLRIPTLRNPSAHFSADEISLIDHEVAELLKKNAIEEIDPSSPSCVSNIFVVPKKDGGFRPIINLKPLNRRFLSPPHFRMDSIKDVASLLRLGDWAASIDLKDAYLHIPLHPSSRPFLRFVWRRILYQFLVLAFGLSTAPFVFTKVTKPIAAYLRAKGIRLIFYLDDILVIGATAEECHRNVQIVLDVLRLAGFLINEKKSSLTPSQLFLYLGLWWNTTSGSVGLEERKLVPMKDLAAHLLSTPRPSCRSVMRLLGLMTWATPAIPLVRLRSRFLQRSLLTVYRTKEDLDRKVLLSPRALEDLQWVTLLTMEVCHAPMWVPHLDHADLRLATDSSDNGWGMFFNGRMENGRWGVDARLHINVKEIRTLHIFFKDFFPHLHPRPSSIVWETDNTAALAYIKNQGGTRSLSLLEEASQILLLAHYHGVTLLPIYVPSSENLHADFASRFLRLPDIHLLPSVFDRLCHLWGRPDIDLFASDASAQLPRFYAWGDAQEAEAFDALSRPWIFDMAFLFPPLALIPRVLTKLQAAVGCYVLILPFWPNQSWHPRLRTLGVVDARRLPRLPDLAVNLTTGKPPPNAEALHLVAWRLFGGPTVSPTSAMLPSISSAPVGEILPTIATTALGRPSSVFSFPERYQSILPL